MYETVKSQESPEEIKDNHIQIYFWKHSNSPEDMSALDIFEQEVLEFADQNPEKKIEIIIDHIHTPYNIIKDFENDQKIGDSVTDAYIKLLMRDPKFPKDLDFDQGRQFIFKVWHEKYQFHQKTFAIMDTLQQKLGKDKFTVSIEGYPDNYYQSNEAYSKSKEILFFPTQFYDMTQQLLNQDLVGTAFKNWQGFVIRFGNFTKARESALANRTKEILTQDDNNKALFFLFGDSHMGLRSQLEVLPKDQLSIGYKFLGKNQDISYDPFTAVILNHMCGETPLTLEQNFSYFVSFLAQCEFVHQQFGTLNNDNYETNVNVWEKINARDGELKNLFVKLQNSNLKNEELLSFVRSL
jgi:hypothetical protein